MVPVVQSVRASDCGSECRGFESHRAPKAENPVISEVSRFFCIFSEGIENGAENPENRGNLSNLFSYFHIVVS